MLVGSMEGRVGLGIWLLLLVSFLFFNFRFDPLSLNQFSGTCVARKLADLDRSRRCAVKQPPFLRLARLQPLFNNTFPSPASPQNASIKLN